MSWQPEVDEIKRRVELAKQMGGEANVARQHNNGRLTVRERIERLLDANSFHETGALAGKATYENEELVSFTPSNVVSGTGRIEQRRVVVSGDDFTVRGGAADGAVGYKSVYAIKMAREFRIPYIGLIDGTGGGGSVKTLETMQRTYVPYVPGWDEAVALLSEVPVVAACLGPVAGLGAVRAVNAHFSVMVKGISQLFVAGPPVVERGTAEKVTKEELGGTHIHTRGSGCIDNEVETEDEAFAQIRRFLSYLPTNVWHLPLRSELRDDPARREEELLSLIPRDRRRTYDIRKILSHVLDRDSFFEIARYYGKPAVVGLARLNGYPVGVLANDPKQLGGSFDAAACEKVTRFVDLCDTFHLPVVNFVDQPGFLIGTKAEREGTARYGARMMGAIYQATIPWVSIILRRVYGVAGAGHGKHHRLNLRYAWPSGDWGSLPIEGGVMAAYKRDIEAAPDPAARLREIEQMLNELRSPFRTAEAFGIEEIIDPRDTRPLLCDWVTMAYDLLPQEVGAKHRGLRP
ncbi:MAG: carboxyl transferase domain-containing protein [Blastocatellia bacterium]